jgi:CubicO group peptidase (beta-lactamase class C family)
MQRFRSAAVAVSVLIAGSLALAQRPADRSVRSESAATALYFPDRFEWRHKKPDEVGLDPARLDEAVKLAIASENPAPRDLTLTLAETFGRDEPFDTPIGPVKARGPATGLIVRHGYIVAEWGEPLRVDMTFSVTKTFLTTIVGLAWQRGLIHDVHDYVRDYMPPGVDLFDAPHNQNITWEHMLRQTSDWQGSLWGKPDWADRPEGQKSSDWPNRRLWDPGTHYKYNDVRMNALSLAALEVWRRALPDVLREEIMEPIGASSTWRWFGYDNSWVEIDGHKIQSVPAGGHWGGGMFINAYDMARFGYLFLRNGTWKDRPIVAPKWIEMARTPGPANNEYGFANWFLNTARKPLPSAPATSVTFRGNGQNIIYVDWDNDIIAVVRWIETTTQLDQVVGKILGALTTPAVAAR